MDTDSDQKNTPKGKNQYLIYQIITIIIIIISFILDAIKCKLTPLQDQFHFIMYLILIGIILLPLLDKLKLFNFFELGFKNLNSTVERLNNTISNFMFNLNLTNKQSVNINFPTSYGINIIVPSVVQTEEKIKLANSLLSQKRLLEASEIYKEVLKIDPNNWGAALLLGYIYLSLPDYEINNKTWGFDDNERLMKSIYYSYYATLLDINHFNQFMNLGIAQCKLGEKTLINLGIQNLEKAFNMLDYDKNNVDVNPALYMEKCKVRIFMGEFEEWLNSIEKAINYRNEAMKLFEDGQKLFSSSPVWNQLYLKWHKINKDSLDILISKKQ